MGELPNLKTLSVEKRVFWREDVDIVAHGERGCVVAAQHDRGR